MCVALMLIHCKNNANHCRINEICIALMLIHCKNNAVHCKIDDICTEVPGGAGDPQKDPSRRKAKSDKFTYRKALFLSTWRQPCKIEKSREARKTPPEIANRRPGTQRRPIILMLIHCKNNAIHCKIIDICISWMLIHCKTMLYVLPGC